MTQPVSELSEPRIFISYARKDGREAAEAFEKLLIEAGLTSWRDLKDMGAGDIWPQVKDAIEHAEHLIVILTPRALASTWVRKEWNHARHCGVQVSPVLADPTLRNNDLPPWLAGKEVFDLREPERREHLLRSLRAPGRVRRVPFDAPHLPSSLVHRPVQYTKIKAAVLTGPTAGTVGITTSLAGSGGYGKTTLANTLLTDEEVRFHFHDGILRLEIGKERSTVLSLIGDLILRLRPNGQRYNFQDVESAANHLAEVIGDARLLLVLDDVWREGQLRPFLRGGRNCVRLITTRTPALPDVNTTIPVDQLQPAEALSLLSWGLPVTNPTKINQLNALAKRLGYWAQMLEIANSWLRERIAWNEGLDAALSAFTKRLDKKGLTAFDAQDADARNRAIGLCVDASIEELKDSEKARLMELSILPEDTDVPLDTVGALWRRTGNLDDLDSDDLLARLHRLSLLQRLDRGAQSVRLHDNMKWLLRERLGPDGVRVTHKEMAAAIRREGGGTWATLPATDTYGWKYGLSHLRAGGEANEVSETLLSYEWMRAKMLRDGAHALFEAYLEEPTNSPAYLVRCALAVSIPALLQAPGQLGLQLSGRLTGSENIALRPLLQAVMRDSAPVKPRGSHLSPPGAELLRLDAHQGGANYACFSPDDLYILSSGRDGFIRLWDAVTGAELAAENCGVAAVRVCYSNDGKYFYTSHIDGKIRKWDAGDFLELNRWDSGHRGRVEIDHSPSEPYLLSSGEYGSLILWYTSIINQCVRLSNDYGNISSAKWAPDGRHIAFSGIGNTVRIWSVAENKELARRIGHRSPVSNICWSPDGHTVLSIDTYGHNEILNIDKLSSRNNLINRLTGLSHLLWSPTGDHILAITMNGYINKIESNLGSISSGLYYHSKRINSVCWSRKGCSVLSSSDDGTVRIWKMDDVQSGSGEQNNRIERVKILPDGRHIIVLSNKTISITDTINNEEKYSAYLGNYGYCSILFKSGESNFMILSRNGEYCKLSIGDFNIIESGKFGIGRFSSVSNVSSENLFLVHDADYQRALLFLHENNKSMFLTSFQCPAETRSVVLNDTGVNFLTVGKYIESYSANSIPKRNSSTIFNIDINWKYKENDNIYGGPYVCACYSPCGDSVAIGSNNGSILIVESKSGTERNYFLSNNGPVSVLQYTPDGQYIVSGGGDCSVRIWCARTFRLLTVFTLDSEVTALDCHCDCIAVGDALGNACVFDLNREMLQ